MKMFSVKKFVLNFSLDDICIQIKNDRDNLDSKIYVKEFKSINFTLKK